MAVTHQRLTVSTAAVALNTASTSGERLAIKNTSANAADLRSSGVTAATGYDLAGGASVVLELAPGEVLFAIRSAAADAPGPHAHPGGLIRQNDARARIVSTDTTSGARERRGAPSVRDATDDSLTPAS
jgi:hypothetical protein